MKVSHIDEPELEFGAGRHVDIRFGIMEHGPLDVSESAMRSLDVAVVGTPETTERLGEWLVHCRNEISAKPSRQSQLFVHFPGFRQDVAFRSELRIDARHIRTIPQARFDELADTASPDHIVAGSSELFLEELRVLAESPQVDLVICAPPMTVVRAKSDPAAREAGVSDPLNFRRLLKARAMQVIKAPIQIVLPMTYDPQMRKKLRPSWRESIRLQDEATRAWNLHTALYYKAGGIPWRLPARAAAFTVCFVGVSFYKTDDHSLHTAMAQVFNERGEGLIIRGGPARVSKDDRQPHLTRVAATELLNEAIRRYRQEHGNSPARIVVHKTSRFTAEERGGFGESAADARVEDLTLAWLRRASTRLFRTGRYPPLRGTMLDMGDVCCLYTRGSVDFYETYPGMYVPRPVEIRVAQSEHTLAAVASEVLALTKMNWNASQFDNRDPITVSAARQVGHVLKYLGDSDVVAFRYGYYM